MPQEPRRHGRRRDVDRTKPCIRDTVLTIVRPIYPRYTNRYGTLHGGRAAWWLLETAAMTAMKLTRGYVVLGAIEHLFIHTPGRLGENLYIAAAALASTTHTLDLAAVAVAEPVGGGERRVVATTLATFVAVDEAVKPRPHGVEPAPCSSPEEELAGLAAEWRKRRQPLIEKRREIAGDTSPLNYPGTVTSYIVVSPDSTFSIPTVLDASKLFYTIDQVAAVTAMRQAGSPVVTAGFDTAVFASPAMVGDMVRLDAVVSGAGRTSIETLIKVIAENPVEERRNTVAVMYTTLVAVGPDGRPTPPRKKPTPPQELAAGYQERRRERAEVRRRASRLATLLASLAGLEPIQGSP